MKKENAAYIPEILKERFEMLQELESAREIAKNFSKGASQTEIEFVRNRIAELEKELSESEPEATELINRLKEIDFIAFTATYQRFIRGLQWKEIAFNHGMTDEAIRQRFYKAMKALSLALGESGT